MNDDILEFSSFEYAVDFALIRSNKIAQDKGPLEFKYKDKVNFS